MSDPAPNILPFILLLIFACLTLTIYVVFTCVDCELTFGFEMGGGDRCAIGNCSNDRRYPDKYVIRSHVSTLQFHSLPKDAKLRDIWHKKIAQGRKDYKVSDYVKICSNHFEDGERTSRCPIPTLFLTSSDLTTQHSPLKRKCRDPPGITPKKATTTTPDTNTDRNNNSCSNECSSSYPICFASVQLTRDFDVHFYTGMKDCHVFQCLFDFLVGKAANMQYWKGERQTQKEAPQRYSSDQLSSSYQRPGPDRKLPLEHEFLLVLMRLRLALLIHDLSFRFEISDSLLSSIFITWVRLMRLELSSLIVWPSREVVRQNLPECFQQYYPKLRCIIDCTEVFIETPSSIDTQAQCWSDYKQHCTVKFLVSITPNGSISYVSPCYDGRASDKFITNDCNFLKLLEPNDQVIADRGFKIKEDLMTVQATLAIPPSTVGSLQMCSSAVRDTSKIANVRIYVEQAIGRLKNYRFLKNEILITCLPVVDDIVNVCSALCNLLDPLC